MGGRERVQGQGAASCGLKGVARVQENVLGRSRRGSGGGEGVWHSVEAGM